MIRTYVRIAIYLTVFVLLQVLVMNNIHLFKIITPIVYVYVILKLPFDLDRIAVIIISFLLGLSIDIFSNTFGLHAAATTFMGFVRQPLIYGLIDKKDAPEGSIPSFGLFGVWKFVGYAFILVAMHHIALFVIEAFTFFEPLMMCIKMVSSIILTTLLMCILESFNLGNEKNGKQA